MTNDSIEKNNRFWFLSIDEATKTFGYCILSISKTNLGMLIDKLNNTIKMDDLKVLHDEIKNYIILHKCAMVDLIPEKKDTEISPVERIQALRKYVESVIEPDIKSIVPSNVKLNIPLEFIMGQNHKVNAICSSLIYAFSNHNILIVKPVYKNQIHFKNKEETYLAHWQGKSKTSYNANKKHCIALFQYISKIFKLQIDHLKKKEISHVADAVMGIFGIFWANRQNEIV